MACAHVVLLQKKEAKEFCNKNKFAYFYALIHCINNCFMCL